METLSPDRTQQSSKGMSVFYQPPIQRSLRPNLWLLDDWCEQRLMFQPPMCRGCPGFWPENTGATAAATCWVVVGHHPAAHRLDLAASVRAGSGESHGEDCGLVKIPLNEGLDKPEGFACQK